MVTQLAAGLNIYCDFSCSHYSMVDLHDREISLGRNLVPTQQDIYFHLKYSSSGCLLIITHSLLFCFVSYLFALLLR